MEFSKNPNPDPKNGPGVRRIDGDGGTPDRCTWTCFGCLLACGHHKPRSPACRFNLNSNTTPFYSLNEIPSPVRRGGEYGRSTLATFFKCQVEIMVVQIIGSTAHFFYFKFFNDHILFFNY